MKKLLRARQMLGKYRIERLLAQGGFGEVYRAVDTIEGRRVALKIPYAHLVDQDLLDDFRREVRLTAQLDHPNILPIKNAAFVDSHFVIASPLGGGTLADRLKRRVSFKVALEFAEQMLEALAFAHRRRIVHCDVKPENFILFPGNRLRLTDFGIARVALHTLSASGSGTLGYIAPEQAMGKPSYRSDVFSLGLILYRMFSGQLPQWPFEKPYPGYQRLRTSLLPELLALIARAVVLEPRDRFENADAMWKAFLRLKPRALGYHGRRLKRRRASAPRQDWKEVRWRQFRRRYGRALETKSECPRCKGPVAESMIACSWCGESIPRYRGKTQSSRRCPRCRRGLKLDWRFCPWCHGPSLRATSSRSFSDSRYSARCHNKSCSRRLLMPFMRYCPWCRQKVRRRWPIPDGDQRCSRCGWGVVPSFWDYCPWCGSAI